MKYKLSLIAFAALTSVAAQAADWSDTSIALTTGSKFKDPYTYNGGDISKNITSLTHVSGDKYGTNFFNADLLESDSHDENAQEAYVVYRRMFDFGKIKSTKYAFGPVRGVGATVGFDWNTKNDTGYGSKKRMLVAGPTLMFDVPGFLNASLLLLDESNAPLATQRYHYKTHTDLSFSWGIPTGINNLGFEGYADIIASKGKNEYGGSSSQEMHFNGSLMYDISAPIGAAKNTFKLGAGYEWWKNKFGNNSATTPGAFAKTPFVKAEYHF